MAFENKKIGDKIYVLVDSEIEEHTIEGIRFPRTDPDMIYLFIGGDRPLRFNKKSTDGIDKHPSMNAPKYRYYSSLHEAQKRKRLDIQQLIHDEMRLILPRLRRLKKLHGGDLSVVRKRVEQLFTLANENPESKK